MFDSTLQAHLKPALAAAARVLLRAGFTANRLTLLGFILGLAAAGCIVYAHYNAGLALILLSRLCDGLDGAVARLTQPTDAGGFLDITLDFLFYAAIPLAFALTNPPANALAAAVLLAAFMGTGASFLAYAAVAEKRGLKSATFPAKSFYFIGGLTEATETLAMFVSMCLWPEHFALLAYGFAGLCAVTIGLRIMWGYRVFSEK